MICNLCAGVLALGAGAALAFGVACLANALERRAERRARRVRKGRGELAHDPARWPGPSGYQ